MKRRGRAHRVEGKGISHHNRHHPSLGRNQHRQAGKNDRRVIRTREIKGLAKRIKRKRRGLRSRSGLRAHNDDVLEVQMCVARESSMYYDKRICTTFFQTSSLIMCG